LKLRQGLLFSDGHPFSADDVLFSFQAAYGTYQGRHSVVGGVVQVGDKPLAVAKIDANTVSVTFPARTPPGVRLLDNLPILPKHKLAAAVQDGSFLSAWGFSTPASEIVGLGPFIVKEYTGGPTHRFSNGILTTGEKTRTGRQLPYLDRLTLEIIPDANAEQLRLEAGQIDMTASEVPPESYASVKRAADAGKVKLFDLGVALDGDSFWFNLPAGSVRRRIRAAPGCSATNSAARFRWPSIAGCLPTRCISAPANRLMVRRPRRTRNGIPPTCRRYLMIRRAQRSCCVDRRRQCTLHVDHAERAGPASSEGPP
jgi:hypothetical protein